MKRKFIDLLLPIYSKINSHTGNSLAILRVAFSRFNKVRGAEAAASVAYYALFSLFPLLLVLVSVLGYLPIVKQAPQRVINFITQAIPISRTLISDTLSQVLKNRGASGLIGLIGLAWSASGVFTTLARNINRAWPRAKKMNFWESRIIALIIILLLGILLIATVLVNTITNILPAVNWRLQLNLPLINSAALFSEIISWAMALLVFTSLYRWVPNTQVPWRNALWGGAIATLAWEITSKAFTYYLSSGLATYDLLYGSLGAIVALLTWTYLSSYIILLGAHISSAIDNISKQNPEPESTPA